MIQWPQPAVGEAIHKYVWLMVFSYANQHIPLIVIPLGNNFVPSGWNCKYDDLTEDGKLQYTLLVKMNKLHLVTIVTGIY